MVGCGFCWIDHNKEIKNHSLKQPAYDGHKHSLRDCMYDSFTGVTRPTKCILIWPSNPDEGRPRQQQSWHSCSLDENHIGSIFCCASKLWYQGMGRIDLHAEQLQLERAPTSSHTAHRIHSSPWWIGATAPPHLLRFHLFVSYFSYTFHVPQLNHSSLFWIPTCRQSEHLQSLCNKGERNHTRVTRANEIQFFCNFQVSMNVRSCH